MFNNVAEFALVEQLRLNLFQPVLAKYVLGNCTLNKKSWAKRTELRNCKFPQTPFSQSELTNQTGGIVKWAPCCQEVLAELKASFSNMDRLKSHHGYVITCIIKCSIKLVICTQTSKMQMLKFGNAEVISSQCDYLSMLECELIHVSD